MLYEDLTAEIISAFYAVHNTLKSGFLESVYENAMILELRSRGLSCQKQKEITVSYKGSEIGCFYADICVEDKVILELKAVGNLAKEHENQLYNYLRASKIEVGLLMNFGRSATFKRKVYTNKQSA